MKQKMTILLIFLWLVSQINAHGKNANIMGTVQSISANSIKVKDTHGKIQDILYDKVTKFIKDGKTAKSTDLKISNKVVVHYKKNGDKVQATKIVFGKAEVAEYSCPMHPEVISDKPGKCPKCGMKLQLKKQETEDHKEHEHDGKN